MCTQVPSLSERKDVGNNQLWVVTRAKRRQVWLVWLIPMFLGVLLVWLLPMIPEVLFLIANFLLELDTVCVTLDLTVKLLNIPNNCD